MAEHVLYKTGDKDAPDVIKDANGEVVLGLCRYCNKGEIELLEHPECPAFVDCHTCGGSGFSGHGTGYGDVCPTCGGLKVELVDPNDPVVEIEVMDDVVDSGFKFEPMRFGCWFEPGQVVRLKSGGPLMTVEAILHDDKNAPIVVCTWFNGGIAEEADFYETSLKLVGGDS